MQLDWPYEAATPAGAGIARFTQAASNICLDFHGDPSVAPQCLAHDRADVAIVFYHLALRYVRVFPDLFDLVPLTAEGDPAQAAGAIHLAQVGDGGTWGARLLEFLLGGEVGAVYRHHGLLPAR